MNVANDVKREKRFQSIAELAFDRILRPDGISVAALLKCALAEARQAPRGRQDNLVGHCAILQALSGDTHGSLGTARSISTIGTEIWISLSQAKTIVHVAEIIRATDDAGANEVFDEAEQLLRLASSDDPSWKFQIMDLLDEIAKVRQSVRHLDAQCTSQPASCDIAAALSTARRLQSPDERAIQLKDVAKLLADRGENAQAVEVLNESLRIPRSIAHPHPEQMLQIDAIPLRVQADDVETALCWARAACGGKFAKANALLKVVEALVRKHDWSTARPLIGEYLSSYPRDESGPSVPCALFAEICLHTNEPDAALELLGQGLRNVLPEPYVIINSIRGEVFARVLKQFSQQVGHDAAKSLVAKSTDAIIQALLRFPADPTGNQGFTLTEVVRAIACLAHLKARCGFAEMAVLDTQKLPLAWMRSMIYLEIASGLLEPQVRALPPQRRKRMGLGED